MRTMVLLDPPNNFSSVLTYGDDCWSLNTLADRDMSTGPSGVLGVVGESLTGQGSSM